MVTARFWPLAGEEERELLRLADLLLEAGHSLSVVSAAWKKSWPREMCVGCVPLVRLRGSPKSSLSALRWMYSLNRWLQEQAGELDAVLVAGLRQEAYVAIRALADSRVPVIVLAQEADLDWQRTATFGQRIARRTHQTAAIVAASSTQSAILARAGYEAPRIHVLPRTAALPPPRSPVQRDAARLALGAVNHDLIAVDTIPVALAVGRLDDRSRFAELVRAWRVVTMAHREARLWILGDGPERERLFRQISDLDLKGRVLLPGTFDHLEEIMQAADMFVQPRETEAAPAALVQALAAGLPVVAADCPAVREVVEPDRTGILIASTEPRTWAAAIEALLAEPARAIALGAAARDWVRSQPTPAERAERLVRLIRDVLSTEY
jgi:glycosyltransferase involved in cell wall biosynthesis